MGTDPFIPTVMSLVLFFQPLQKIFNAALEGRDMGISMPIKGHASISKESFKNMGNIFSKKQKTINLKFEKIAADNNLYTSYG